MTERTRALERKRYRVRMAKGIKIVKPTEYNALMSQHLCHTNTYIYMNWFPLGTLSFIHLLNSSCILSDVFMHFKMQKWALNRKPASTFVCARLLYAVRCHAMPFYTKRSLIQSHLFAHSLVHTAKPRENGHEWEIERKNNIHRRANKMRRWKHHTIVPTDYQTR